MGSCGSPFEYCFGKYHERLGYGRSLGSNMGDKKAYLDMAESGWMKRKDCQVKAVSDFLVTAPYGVTDQDDFLNGVLELRTMLDPEELLRLSIRSNRRLTVSEKSTGVPGRWIWIFCFMMILFWIRRNFISLILKCS